MGLLSTTTSLTRYSVKGKLDDPIIESVAAGLKKNTIADIDGGPADHSVGWARFDHPYMTGFEGNTFVMGTHLVFSLRVDKKAIPAKMVQKYFAAESEKRLKASGRDFLSADEKKTIKDHVINQLNLKIPATPNVYDVVWNYEQGELWFFSNLKNANEHLESLFQKSFQLQLIRKIPYTTALDDQSLTDAERDLLNALATRED
jgi:hypothetical protein